MPEGRSVDELKIETDADGQSLSWSESTSIDVNSGAELTGYRIYFGLTLDEMEFIAKTDKTTFLFRNSNENRSGFFKVIAAYRDDKRRVRRDDEILLDFEDLELVLESFDENEDIDIDSWEITDEQALPESEHSLKLGGNCWKKYAFGGVELSDSTVWSLGIMSIDGDTMASLQAFGVSDGENRLFYAFHGLRNVWQEDWVVSYQDVHRRGRWQVYRMAIGYDWNIRYGYLPEIEELYFINDNDDNDTSAVIYFDDLTDITESIPSAPAPQIFWRIAEGRLGPQGWGSGATVVFYQDVINREPEEISYSWDFGDGTTADLARPSHRFGSDGRYTVSLTVTDEEGYSGEAISDVYVGQEMRPQLITIGCVGDVMLARRYEQRGGIIETNGVESIFERIRDRFASLDLRMINLESVLTNEGIRHPTKEITFRGSPENVTGLSSIGIDFANLGNNHAHDYGERGLEETLEVLDSAGIGHSGAGMNELQALTPTFRTVKGIRVGMLGYCNRTGRDYNSRPYGDAGYDRYGFAYFSADNLLRSIPDAAEQCDLLVIYVHGGSEYAIDPADGGVDDVYPPWHEERLTFPAERDSATRALEHYAIELGAGLVIGGHPHVLQGIEVYEDVVIAHSVGNFAFDQNFFETWPSVMVCADVNHDGAVKVWLEPFFVDNYRPTPTVENLGSKILDRLAGYSIDMSCVVVPDYDQMTAEVVLDPNRVSRRVTEHTVSGRLRYFEQDSVYRSEPIRLDAGGFPSRIVSVDSDVREADWNVSLGREILLVGNMEHEGAQIWNYNSDFEGIDEEIILSGTKASYITRQAGWGDGITDLTQRIPVVGASERLTLCGWLKSVNALDGGLVARYYRYRYNNDEGNILGDQVVEDRIQGDNDWAYIWDQLIVPQESEFLNVRWQLYGAEEGADSLWCDDVELIRWNETVPLEGGLNLDSPSDLYYIQVETTSQVEEVEITYRTVTISY